MGSGGQSNGIVPEVANAFADLHNHPKNTPPSSGDLYGLIRKNRNNALYDTRFVLTPGGTLYALVITDTAAAQAFLHQFPPQQYPGYSPLFPDALLNEYRDVIHLYGAKEELAMAHVLVKYSTGVILLKQSTDGMFRMLRTRVLSIEGQLQFSENQCPGDTASEVENKQNRW
jgi:hypothetical protein